MLERCYSLEYKENQPTYINSIVDCYWHNFQVFAEWFKNNYKEGYELDKDLLVRGNKNYSPNTCCFIPKYINTLLIKCDSKRGKYFIGVRKRKNRFEARCQVNGKPKYIGSFETELEAFYAYKNAKESDIKEVAEKYKDQITERCYWALINYKVNIND